MPCRATLRALSLVVAASALPATPTDFGREWGRLLSADASAPSTPSAAEASAEAARAAAARATAAVARLTAAATTAAAAMAAAESAAAAASAAARTEATSAARSISLVNRTSDTTPCNCPKQAPCPSLGTLRDSKEQPVNCKSCCPMLQLPNATAPIGTTARLDIRPMVGPQSELLANATAPIGLLAMPSGPRSDELLATLPDDEKTYDALQRCARSCAVGAPAVRGMLARLSAERLAEQCIGMCLHDFAKPP